jgi:hypothetical protein
VMAASRGDVRASTFPPNERYAMSDDSVVKLIARGTLTDRLIEDGSRGWQPGISGRPGCRRKGRDRGLSLQPRDEGQSVAVHDWAGQIRLPLAGEQRRGCDTDYTVDWATEGYSMMTTRQIKLNENVHIVMRL